ncbi:hypothetical protein GJ496_011587 [Pomphorhynchus laevis]|nr:hypothetical protein GJ496_011587 [Pomphorhynchus laevis]
MIGVYLKQLRGLLIALPPDAASQYCQEINEIEGRRAYIIGVVCKNSNSQCIEVTIIDEVDVLDVPMNKDQITEFSESAWQHEQNPDYWRNMGRQSLRYQLNKSILNKPSKNAILLIGDGMGVSTTSAGPIHQHWIKLPFTGLSKTYNIDYQTPDSAATATAYLCGVKSRSGTIGVNGFCKRSDYSCCGKSEYFASSILAAAKQAGKSTGIVTSTRITHASPASAFAHCPNRDWEVFDDENFSKTEYAHGCRDIADQLIDNFDILDVVIGGGRTNFIPNTMADPEYPEVRGRRVDGRNLIEEWKAKMTSKGKTPNFVWSNNDFHNLSTNKIDNLLALLEPSHMHYEIDRIKLKLSEPSLAQMTATAISILQKNPNGFVLFVEGGRIDHGHHGTEARRALGDFASFDDSLNTCLQLTSADDTQIVVSADHSHVFTVGGYAYRNNDIFGFAANDMENGSNVDGMPFTSILYGNGPGYINSSDRLNKSYWNTVDLHSHDFKYHSAVPLNSESHGAEDVIVYASGPRSHLYTGTFEQSDIFHYMVYSMCLNEYSNDANCW